MTLHTVVLLLVALFGVPLIGFYINVSRRSNAAHLEVLQASDAGNKIGLSRWQRLERWQFVLGALFASMLAVIFWMRFIAGDNWSLIDNVSLWIVGLIMIGWCILSEHYKLEDEFASIGVGRRVRIVNPY